MNLKSKLALETKSELQSRKLKLWINYSLTFWYKCQCEILEKGWTNLFMVSELLRREKWLVSEKQGCKSQQTTKNLQWAACIEPDGMHTSAERAGPCHCEASLNCVWKVTVIRRGSWQREESKSHCYLQEWHKGKFREPQSLLNLWDSNGSNPPGNHFQLHERHVCD